MDAHGASGKAPGLAVLPDLRFLWFLQRGISLECGLRGGRDHESRGAGTQGSWAERDGGPGHLMQQGLRRGRGGACTASPTVLPRSGACCLRLWPASEGSPCTRVPGSAGSEGHPACTHLCCLSLCQAAPAAEGPRWPRGWWVCSTLRATAAQHRTDPNWPPDGAQGMRGPPAFQGCARGQRGPQ